MAAFDDTTPGSAVANQLQQILLQKRNQQRQDMMDQLNAQNVQSQMQYRQDQAETNKSYRDAWARQRDALAAEEQDKANRRTQTLANFDNYMQSPAFSQLDPSIQQQFRAARISGDPQELTKVIGNMGAMNKPNPYPGGELYEMDPDSRETNDTGIWLNGVRGDQVKALQRTPRPPASEVTPQPFTRTDIPNDPNDPSKGVHTETRWVAPNQSWEQGRPLAVGGAVRNYREPPPAKLPKGVSDAQWKLYTGARNAWLANPSDAKAEQELKDQANRVISLYPASPEVKQHVKDAFSNPAYRKATSQQLLATATSGSDEDKAAFADLWSQLNGIQ